MVNLLNELSTRGNSSHKPLRLTLLFGHTDCSSSPAGCLGMLTPYTKTPVVTKTTVSFDLFQSLQIFTKLIVKGIGSNLVVLAILDILLPIEEPIWNLVLPGVAYDGEEFLNFGFIQFTSSLTKIHIGFFANDISKSAADTFNGGQGVHNVPFTIDVGVEDTKNVLELVRHDELLRGSHCVLVELQSHKGSKSVASRTWTLKTRDTRSRRVEQESEVGSD